MSDLDNLPEGFKLTEEQMKVKSYAVATISMDAEGNWHAHYTGYNKVAGKAYFGSSIISSKNIRKMLDVLGSRLAKAESIYADKIVELISKEQIDETTTTESDSVA